MLSTRPGWLVRLPAAALLALSLTECGRPERPNEAANATPAAAAAPAAVAASERQPERQPAELPRRDLAADEAMGGHTLARHVGKTDEELAERLRREPSISSASTYTDRTTAETVVGSALEAGGRPFNAWRQRRGRRPNFVLNFTADRVIGRSLGRGRREVVPCDHVLVILRWDERRETFYVLTSYPEVPR